MIWEDFWTVVCCLSLVRQRVSCVASSPKTWARTHKAPNSQRQRLNISNGSNGTMQREAKGSLNFCNGNEPAEDIRDASPFVMLRGLKVNRCDGVTAADVTS